MPRQEPSRLLPHEAHMLINEHFGPSDDGAEKYVIHRQIELNDIRHLTYAVINEITGKELPENRLTLGVQLHFDTHPDEMRQLLSVIDDIRSRFTALGFDISDTELASSDVYSIDFSKEVPVKDLNKTIMELLEQFREEEDE